MTKNDVNVKEMLEEKYVVPESIFDRNRTKTSHFMLNTIFPKSSLILTEYFVNAFLDDHEYKHNLVRPLFVLFRMNQKDAKWDAIVERLRLKKEYVLEYFCGSEKSKNLLMMVFQIPQSYAKDYILFKTGKYSQFTAEYKKLFNRYTHNERLQPVESTIWRVLHKSPELKKELIAFFEVDNTRPLDLSPEDEFWGKPELPYEVYRYKENKN